MTPQEFFKKDCFADKAGVELIEIKALFTLAVLALAAAANSHGTLAFSLSSNITFLRSSGPGDILYAEARERYIGRTTGHYQIDITNQNGELVATFESSIFRKGDALPFTL